MSYTRLFSKKILWVWLVVALLGLSLATLPVQAQIPQLTDDLVAQFQTIANNMPGRDSEGFIAPSSGELTNWRQLIQMMLAEDWIGAHSFIQANFPFYVLYEFTDTGNNSAVYYLVRESFPVTKGWGTFVFAPNFDRQMVMEMPHPLYDINTPTEGADLWRLTGSRYLIMAGTHRCANTQNSGCDGSSSSCGGPLKISDMAHSVNTPFHATHEEIVLFNAQTYQIQVHGMASCSEDIFLSNGHATVTTPKLIQLRDEILAQGGLACQVAGQSSCDLSGSTNVQGRYTNGSPNPCTQAAQASDIVEYFIHAEQLRFVRDNYSEYVKFANALNIVIPLADNQPPVANANGPYSGDTGVALSFSSAGSSDSDGTITAYLWDFGDNSTSSAANPTHAYFAAGTYSVILTVTDNGDANDSDTTTATISDPVGTWITLSYDNFESGMGSYTDGGADMSRYTGTTHAHQGAAAADIQDNSGTASSFYHTASYNVTGYSTLEVDFWFKMVSMETNEDFWVQYFDGTTWRTVATFARGATYQNNVFYHPVVTISSGTYNFPTNAKLRFMCDASDNNDDVYIDEIGFRGLTGGALAKGDHQLNTTETLNAAQMLPVSFELKQNYPNPFNPSTNILFVLPEAGAVTVKIFNTTGQEIYTLADGTFQAGYQTLLWDGRDESGNTVAAGMYLYQIKAFGENGELKFSETKRMVLVK